MKLCFLLCTIFFYSLNTAWTKEIKHSQFNFPISTHKIKMGDIHYSFVSVSKDSFLKEAGPFLSMASDTRSAPMEGKYALVRAVFPINKAVGYFDTEKFNDLNFIRKIEKNQKVKKVRNNTFLTQTSVPVKHQYFSKFHFDSDDLSSLPDSKIGRIITDLKSSDPLLLSANATVFREMYGYSDLLKKSSEFYGLVSLDETKTLVVYMKLMILSSDDTLDYAIERDLIKKIKVLKETFENIRD